MYVEVTSYQEEQVLSNVWLQITGWPALFGAAPGTDEYHIPELLVVGAAEATTGKRWPKSGWNPDKRLPHIYGPGDWLLGVQGDKTTWVNGNPATYKDTYGTSVGKLKLERR